jgi:hypothetical protein
MAHVIGKAIGFFPVRFDPAADVGMKPDQVVNGGVLGVGFESVGHIPKVGPPPLLRLWRLRHNTVGTRLTLATSCAYRP